MRLILRLLFLGTFISSGMIGATTSFADTPSTEDFLASREVIGSIQFQLGSSKLSTVSRAKLDTMIDLLKNVDPEKKVVRVEGFASPEGPEKKNLKLSMKRAVTVENYLRGVRHLPPTRYLVGRGIWTDKDLDVANQRRVEIVLYDNLLDMEHAVVDKIIFDGKKN